MNAQEKQYGKEVNVDVTKLVSLPRLLRPVSEDVVIEWAAKAKDKGWDFPRIEIMPASETDKIKDAEGKETVVGKGMFYILDGEQRTAAARLNHLKQIPALQHESVPPYLAYLTQLNANLRSGIPITLAQRNRAIRNLFKVLVKDKAFETDKTPVKREAAARKKLEDEIGLGKMSISRILRGEGHGEEAAKAGNGQEETAVAKELTPAMRTKKFLERIVGLCEVWQEYGETVVPIIKEAIGKGDVEVQGTVERLITFADEIKRLVIVK